MAPGTLPAGLSRQEEPASRWTPPTAIGLQGARSRAAIGSRTVGLGVIGRREMAGFPRGGGEVRAAMLARLRQPRRRLLPGGRGAAGGGVGTVWGAFPSVTGFGGEMPVTPGVPRAEVARPRRGGGTCEGNCA